MICPKCSKAMNDGLSNNSICTHCGTICENINNKLIEPEIPYLEIGSIVKIVNKQHPWYKDIAIIRGKQHKHYRIEIHGGKIWVPEHWVEEI